MKKWLRILGVIVLIAILVLILVKVTKREFETFTFPDTMVVENYSNNRMADTITMVLLNKVLDYDTMTIYIHTIPPAFLDHEQYDFKALISKPHFVDRTYNLFLKDKLGVISVKHAITHEIIHLEQYESGRLQLLTDNEGYVWEGDTIKYSDVDYKKREHEIEAIKGTAGLKSKLNKVLYK